MLLGLGEGLLGQCLSLEGPQVGVAGTDIGQGRIFPPLPRLPEGCS